MQRINGRPAFAMGHHQAPAGAKHSGKFAQHRLRLFKMRKYGITKDRIHTVFRLRQQGSVRLQKQGQFTVFRPSPGQHFLRHVNGRQLPQHAQGLPQIRQHNSCTCANIQHALSRLQRQRRHNTRQLAGVMTHLFIPLRGHSIKKFPVIHQFAPQSL